MNKIIAVIVIIFAFTLGTIFSADLATATFPGDNGKIVFRSTSVGGNPEEIYVMNADGSGQTRLTNNAVFDGDPSWSPDGTKIAFRSQIDGNSEIYVMNADGTGQTRLTFNGDEDAGPSWSPDGTKIAFSSGRDGIAGNPAEIYVMNADGTSQTRITFSAGSDSLPSWSPDGTKIAFTSNRDGNLEIYVMNADGTGQTRLTNNVAFDARTSWSPDGTKIAFTSNRLGLQIYIMNADGTGQTRLTNNAAGFDPFWSPDGTKILFTSSRDGTEEIYVMNAADGTGQTKLTNTGAFDADWQSIPKVVDVDIDIKPGNDTSNVNCKNIQKNVPVAIFTDDNIDALEIEIVSMELQGIPVIEVHNQLHPTDVDGDGDLDAVVHLGKAEVCDATSDLPLKESAEVKLTGQTIDGTQFEGIGDIRIVKR